MTAVNVGGEPRSSSAPARPEPETETARVGSRASHLAILTSFALLATLAQLAILAYVRFVDGRVIYMGWNVVWLAPIAPFLK